jgi:hypothetical protein
VDKPGLSDEHKQSLKLMGEKWSSYVGETANSQAISLMLESQKKGLDDVTDDVREFFEEHFGDSWDEHFLRAYVKALKESPILEFFPPQPMSGPVGAVAWLEMRSRSADLVPTEEGAQIPEIAMDVRLQSVAAKQRDFGNILSPVKGLEIQLGADMRKQVMEVFVAEILHRKMQCLVGMILENNTSALTFDQQPGETLVDAVQHCSYVVHKRTMRGPSTRVVCNPKLEAKVKYHSRWITWTDAAFDDTGVATWYCGPSLLDQPIIWAPYRICFTKSEVEQADVGGENAEMVPVVRAGFRDATHVASPHMIQTLAIKQPGTV